MIGIYALWFEEPSMVYIGQSVNIEARYKSHIKHLRGQYHSNYKLQDCYNLYGQPELVVLEECYIKDLDTKECWWGIEFNCVSHGLNIAPPGKTLGSGIGSVSSKYSKLTVLRVFSLLYKTDLPYSIISKRTKMNESSIRGLKLGATHCWLKEDYPAKYKLMGIKRPNNTKAKEDIIEAFKFLVHTNFSYVEIEKLCKLKSSHIASIRAGKVDRWLKEEFPLEYEKLVLRKNSVTYQVKLISPNNEIVEILNISKFCKDNFPEEGDTFRRALTSVANGTRKVHKGWRLYNE